MGDEQTPPYKPGAKAYAEMADRMRMMADRAASPESRAEFIQLSSLYERLAARASGTYGGADEPPLESYTGTARLPLQETYFNFTAELIMSRAPRGAGVYALWNKDYWIYVGQSGDIQGRLLQHLGGDNDCITHGQPTAFGFELIDDASERDARQAALIRDLKPMC